MNLLMDSNVAHGLKSRSQIARRITEDWGEKNFYCISCKTNSLTRAGNNTKVLDFKCPNKACSDTYQLKSSAKPFRNHVLGGEYSTFMRALRKGEAPHLLLLHYSQEWSAKELIAIPSFFLSSSTVIPRKPLGPDARRAGWRGFNIYLSRIPMEGRIGIVFDGCEMKRPHVRSKFERIRLFNRLNYDARGWTLDVLNSARSLNVPNFTLGDMYKFEAKLAALHPGNTNIRPKIRQQLQVLRDLGKLQFLGSGKYELISA